MSVSHTTRVSVSPTIIFWALLIILGAWFLFVVRDVIFLLFIALIISSALEPLIRRLQRKGMRRGYSVVLLFFVLILLVTALLWYIIPTVVSQANSFLREFPGYVETLTGTRPEYLDKLTDSLRSGDFNGAGLTGGILTTTIGVVSGFVSFFAVLAMSFYMSIVEDGIGIFLRSVTPKRFQKYVVSRAYMVRDKIGDWMVGQLMLMLIISVFYFIVLSLLGVPNALVLAIFGGLLEIIPYFGPIIASIPPIILGFFVAPWVSVAVIIAYTIIQQLENHVLIPQLMRRFVGLNPIVVIVALLIGAQLAGVLGMFLAVPVATAIGVFIKDILDKKTLEESS